MKFSLLRSCVKSKNKSGETVGIRRRTEGNLYVIHEIKSHSCLPTKEEGNDLCHKRLGHLNHKSMRKLINYKSIIDLPYFKRDRDSECSTCQKGKKAQIPYKVKGYTT